MIFLSTFWDVMAALFIAFFVFIPLIMLWGFALADLFMRKASALHKVLWLLGIIIFPILGPIIYVLVHPAGEREQLTWDQSQASTSEQSGEMPTSSGQPSVGLWMCYLHAALRCASNPKLEFVVAWDGSTRPQAHLEPMSTTIRAGVGA